MIRPGLCSVTFRELEPCAVIALAVQAGLAGIEWGGDVHVPTGRRELARTVRRWTEDAGLAIVSYGSYVRAPTDGMDAFSRALETACALGAPTIRVWPGAKDRASADYSPAEREATAEMLRAFVRQAAACGVSVGLEFHPGTLTDNTASARDLAAAVPGVRLYWQPRPGLPLADALTELDEVASYVEHLHVFAWNAARTRFSLETAAPYWTQIFAALPRADRFALLEFVRADKPKAFLEDAAVLRRLVSRVSQGVPSDAS